MTLMAMFIKIIRLEAGDSGLSILEDNLMFQKGF
jgi:hypothetical protein